MHLGDDTPKAQRYRFSAMDEAWQLIQQRHREWLDSGERNSNQVVTRLMVAEWCGVPVERVTIEDGVFRVALDPVSQWGVRMAEVADD